MTATGVVCGPYVQYYEPLLTFPLLDMFHEQSEEEDFLSDERFVPEE